MLADDPGMTQEPCDGLSVKLLLRIKTMPGFLAHSGGPIPGGWDVIEFWDSEEQLDAWIKGVIFPASAANGITQSSRSNPVGMSSHGKGRAVRHGTTGAWK